MKTVFLVFTIHLAEIKCHQFLQVKNSKYSVPIVDFRGTNESLVFIKENNNDDTLITSIIMELYSDQSILVMSGENYRMQRESLHNKDLNLIVLTNVLSLDDLNSGSMKSILNSYWSPINIILTERNGNQTCEKGVLNEVFLENAQDFMNTIWHRHQVVRVIVSFPYTCPHHFIIYSGRKPSNTTLYDRTIKVIQARNKNDLEAAILENSKFQELTKGYPLRANIFYRFPTSITECDTINHYIILNLNYTNGFCGLDGLLMHDFINHYKYNLITPRHLDCNKYGYVDPETHNVSGSLRCILRGELDISFNSRFLVQYNTTKNYFYLHYITVDSLAVALKRAEVVPLWHYAHNTYGCGTGSILLILMVALGVLTWTSAWVTSEITGHSPRKLYFYILNAVTCTLFGFSIERRSDRFRILKGTSLFCSIILLAFYQGNVNYQFTTRTRFREIRTLQELFRSEVVIHTSSIIRTLLLNIMNTNDQIQTTFLQRTQIKNSSTDLGFVLDHPNIGTMARGEDAQIDILRNFTNEDGNSLVYTVEEVFHVYYLAYISRTGFLFVEESLRFMMRMLEAGLPQKYYIWTRRTLTLGDTYPKTGPEPRSYEKIKLTHLRVAFCVLLLGCFVSMCSFLVEVHRGRRSTKK